MNADVGNDQLTPLNSTIPSNTLRRKKSGQFLLSNKCKIDSKTVESRKMKY